MQKEKYLIINIDDFGVSHAANVAARELYKSGKVTSMSIMAGASAYDEAVRIIKEDNIESVGVHLYVTNEYKGENNPFVLSGLTATERLSESGAFTRDFRYSAVYYSEVFMEATAQIEKVIADGISPTHVDCHMYSLWPNGSNDFFETACKMCKKYNIKSIRLSARLKELGGYFSPLYSGRLKRLRARALADSNKLKTADHVYLMQQGKTEEFTDAVMMKNFRVFLSKIPCGISELHFHPAIEDENLKANNPWWQERVAEYNLFSNNDIEAICAEYGIKLISYKDLLDMKRSKLILPNLLSKILKKLDFINF